MRRSGLLALAVAAGAAGLVLLPGSREAAAFPDHPPAAHTGGFGEPTCAACHMGAPLNAPGGELAVEQAPGSYAPGRRYRLAVVLGRGEMAAGGFQMAARCAEGAQAGRQAGELLAAETSRVRVTTDAKSGVQYAHQTAEGTAPAEPGRIGWTVDWTAPAAGCGTVRLDLAANAANGDASALGDHVYARSLLLEPRGR